MTRNQSDQTNDVLQKTRNMNEGSTLPPRSVKHGKRKDEDRVNDQIQDTNQDWNQDTNQDYELDADPTESVQTRSQRTFPFIQIIFWSLISIIIFFVGFWFYQEATFDSLLMPPTKEAFQLEEREETKVSVLEDTEEDQDQGVEEEEKQGTKEEDNAVEDSDSFDSDDEGQANPVEAIDKENETSSPATKEENEVNQPRIIAEHIVMPGETFFSITRHYYKSSKYEDDLAEFNGITDKTNIQAGMKIKIPEIKY